MSINLVMLVFGTIVGIVGIINGDQTAMIISSVWAVGSIIVGEINNLKKRLSNN